jgi:hypothetical protein
MSLALRSLVPLLTLTLVACAGIETSTNYDPNAVGTLSQYHTYSWLPERQGGNTRVYNDVVEAGGEPGAADPRLPARR